MGKRMAYIPSFECSGNISDYQILKDVCMIPGMMSKEYGMEVSIVGYSINQKLLNKYFPEVKFISVKDIGHYLIDISEYLKRNAQNFDIIYLFGAYETYDVITDIYKYYNSEGKIYLKLDMNRIWLSNISNSEYFKSLLNKCDLITVEDRKLQNYINENYNCEVEYLRNGYASFDKLPRVDYKEKENIIISVGRLGVPQKATDILVKAFLDADLPNWQLRLIGDIDDSFLPKINEFKTNPKFNKQVKMLGRIDDKNELYSEYRKAKILCITSQYESCAHVYSEGGISGCYIVSTDVDGISDLKEYSSISPVNDFRGVATSLEKVTRNEGLMKKVCYEIQDYIKNEGTWDILINKLYLLFCVKGLI